MLDLFAFVQTDVGRAHLVNGNINLDPQNRLRFVAIRVYTTSILYRPRVELEPAYLDWEKKMNQINKESEQYGLSNGFHNAGISWTWMATEQSLGINSGYGILIAMLIIYGILVVFTYNVLVSLLAIITVGGIVSCVICVVWLMKWEYGIAESVACVILVGFAVDYVIHLCYCYVEAPFLDRKSRTKYAVGEMGFSIVGSAFTTFSAGLFLFGGIIAFFEKFAVLLSCAISFSLVWALVFFVALCLVFGPNGDVGDLRWFCGRRSFKE